LKGGQYFSTSYNLKMKGLSKKLENISCFIFSYILLL